MSNSNQDSEMSQDQTLDDLEHAYHRCEALEGDVARLRALLKRAYVAGKFYAGDEELCDEIRREMEPKHDP